MRSKASQANMDSQLESRFETGPVSHKVLGGFNLKRFTLDDMQGFEDGAFINLINPVYTPTAPFSDLPYRDAYVTQNQVALYLQDQIKFDRLTLVLSGRNDWVGTIDNILPGRIRCSLPITDMDCSVSMIGVLVLVPVMLLLAT